MVQLSLTLSTLILFIPFLSLAFPLQAPVKHYKPSQYMSGLPANTTHLSLDKDTGKLTAYDITHRVLTKMHSSHMANHSARQSDAGACTAKANSDIQKRKGPCFQPLDTRLKIS
jgi:hypothetical protein